METVVFTCPRTLWVLGLQKLLFPFIFRGNVPLLIQILDSFPIDTIILYSSAQGYRHVLFLNSFSCLSTFFGTNCEQITVGSLYANKFHRGWAFFLPKKIYIWDFPPFFCFQGHVIKVRKSEEKFSCLQMLKKKKTTNFLQISTLAKGWSNQKSKYNIV